MKVTKKQIVAWRGLGEDSSAAWELEIQMNVSLQMIDMLEYEYENKCEEKSRKKQL